MTNIFTTIESICGSFPLLISINTISFFFKLMILLIVVRNIRSIKESRTHIYLIIVLSGALFEDFSWIALLVKNYFFPSLADFPHLIILFIVRFAWVFYVIEYQALCLFVESLVDQKARLNLRQMIFCCISSLFCLALIFVAIGNIEGLEPTETQLILQEYFMKYALFLLIPSTLFFTFSKIKHNKTPRIIKKQAKILFQILFIPRVLSDFIQCYPFKIIPGWDTSSYAIIGISTTILTIALYYCARKVVGLRFLNFQNHVQEHRRYDFVDRFKDTLEEFAKASNIKELGHISQSFFKGAFDIPGNRVSLHLRTVNPIEGSSYKIELNEIETCAETFLSNTNPELEKCVNKVKILIYDEIDFNNFYDPNYADETIIQFLDTINADIFLPIYKNHTIIGYVIVERYARFNEFYSHIERDEMLVFASYLGNIINLLTKSQPRFSHLSRKRTQRRIV